MRSRGRGRTALLSGLLALGSLLVSLAVVEVVLRETGHLPWFYLGGKSHQPVVHEPDPVLGWRVKPGRYEAGPFGKGGVRIHTTILPDGSRATGQRPEDPNAPLLIFVGGSFTLGWAISDEETFAWRLNERYPELRVANYGTAGYGTYQSLLVLERLLEAGERPAIVVYGFIDNHEMRNVATPLWLRVQAMFSTYGMVDVPYVELRDGRLVRHPPERHPAWPLKQQLSLVAWLESRWVDFAGRGREAAARPATERLIREMDELVERHGAHFLAVLLYFAPDAEPAVAEYATFLGRSGIDFADCHLPITGAETVPGAFHPNGEINARWATCIGDAIDARGWLGGPAPRAASGGGG